MTDHSFPKAHRLLKRRDFTRFHRAHAKRFVGKYLLIDTCSSPAKTTRLGITVTRQFGDAHCRNAFKRKIRELFRLHYDQLPQGLDLLVRPRPLAVKADFHALQAEFQRWLRS